MSAKPKKKRLTMAMIRKRANKTMVPGEPMILHLNTKTQLYTDFVELSYNALTDSLLLKPRKTSVRLKEEQQYYYCETLQRASQVAQTMDHYERTGEVKKFKVCLDYFKDPWEEASGKAEDASDAASKDVQGAEKGEEDQSVADRHSQGDPLRG